MDLDAALALLGYAESDGGRWPLRCERPVLDAINTWVAIREGDRDALKRAANWTDAKRAYRVDPLGERIADAWAHYLAGEEPTITPAADADLGVMNELLLGNDLPSEAERGAGLRVSEGEIWARPYVDLKFTPCPMLDWVSRRNVLPYWIGPRLAAAAVWTELDWPRTARKGEVFRHFEVHASGVVVNALYIGTKDRLGGRVELEHHPDTYELEPVWAHEIPGLLLTRVPNRLRGDKRIGVSDYAGVLDYLLDLNEAAVIGAHNARLTARKRAVVTAAALRPRANADDPLNPEENQGAGSPPRPVFDAAEEIFVEDPLDGELGRDGKDPVRILEYSFDADKLIAYKRDLVETILSRVGLTAQYGLGVGAGEGYAITGTALRMRLIPTDAAGRAKSRYQADAEPRIVSVLAQLDALPAERGGYGRPWTDAAGKPTIARRPGIPVDTVEEAGRHRTLVDAGLESKEEAIRELHPDWDDPDVKDELKRLEDEKPATPAGFMGGGFPVGA